MEGKGKVKMVEERTSTKCQVPSNVPGIKCQVPESGVFSGQQLRSNVLCKVQKDAVQSRVCSSTVWYRSLSFFTLPCTLTRNCSTRLCHLFFDCDLV